MPKNGKERPLRAELLPACQEEWAIARGRKACGKPGGGDRTVRQERGSRRKDTPSRPAPAKAWSVPGSGTEPCPRLSADGGRKQKKPVDDGLSLYRMERETGFEPATSTLARLHSTTELLPLNEDEFYRFCPPVSTRFFRKKAFFLSQHFLQSNTIY